jgi:hypothetical protein
MTRALGLMLVLTAGAGQAGEAAFVFRSVEDPAFPPDAAICAQAPFRVNVQLGASLWSQRTRHVDGRVLGEHARRIGRATACVELTNFLFPPGLQQNFYAVFDLPSGRYTAHGTCTLTSNNVPQAGLVLAGCALAIDAAPTGVKGGVITSLSTFNPAHLAGFSTGSLWTLQAYTEDPNANWPWWPTGGCSNFVEDPRSDEAIDAARAALEHGDEH